MTLDIRQVTPSLLSNYASPSPNREQLKAVFLEITDEFQFLGIQNLTLTAALLDLPLYEIEQVAQRSQYNEHSSNIDFLIKALERHDLFNEQNMAKMLAQNLGIGRCNSRRAAKQYLSERLKVVIPEKDSLFDFLGCDLDMPLSINQVLQLINYTDHLGANLTSFFIMLKLEPWYIPLIQPHRVRSLCDENIKTLILIHKKQPLTQRTLLDAATQSSTSYIATAISELKERLFPNSRVPAQMNMMMHGSAVESTQGSRETQASVQAVEQHPHSSYNGRKVAYVSPIAHHSTVSHSSQQPVYTQQRHPHSMLQPSQSLIQAPPVHISPEHPLAHLVNEKPELHMLQAIKGLDGKKYSVFEFIEPHLHQLAISFKVPPYLIDTLLRSRFPVYEFLKDWLGHRYRDFNQEPITWKTFLEHCSKLEILNSYPDMRRLADLFNLADLFPEAP